MHESLTTSSLLAKLKQESPLEVSTCGGHQNAIKGTSWHPFDTIKSWYEKTNEIGPLHTVDRTKMKQLGGVGMPQDAGYHISRRTSFTRPPGWSRMREEECT
jgi:hypothetical protein